MARWLPLESNPTVMNKYLKDLGLSPNWSLCDIYGIDEDLLAIVPQPAVAVILLFPLTEKEENFRKEQQESLKEETVPSDVYFMKQYVGNACGTVALIHSVANTLDQVELCEGHLKSFLDKTKTMTPEERGHALESDDGIGTTHDDLAQEGQTSAPDREAKLDTHFVALVNVDGSLYELDGRKDRPIKHGPTNESSFLSDAAKVCGEFMKREPADNRFAMVALSKSQ